MKKQELNHYRAVQDAARFTLEAMAGFIRPGLSEIDLVEKCDALQRAAGVDSYWFKSLPALVLVGQHTPLAISRMAYRPSNLAVTENDLVTIDLNPAINGYCGDMARSYYIEKGVTRSVPLYQAEFRKGAEAQQSLHTLLRQIAHPDLTCHDLCQSLHEEIELSGFEQLDYLGHSIGKDTDQLHYIVPCSTRMLGELGLFTLEPHICLKQGRYAFKHENIYYFEGRVLHEL